VSDAAPAARALRAALSAPAIVTLVALQALRLFEPGPLASFLLLEGSFLMTAVTLARRVPGVAWAHVPAMWAGVALGALADVWWLGGRAAELPALLGFAAPSLAAGFALADSWPRRGSGTARTDRSQDQ
jgi:hypothetical protein